VLEGLALGGISVVFEATYPGIVNQAVFLTFGTLGALLIAYRAGVIRATDNFKRGVVAGHRRDRAALFPELHPGILRRERAADSFQRHLRDPVQPVRRRDRGAQSRAGF
jgi:hypothetical protein